MPLWYGNADQRRSHCNAVTDAHPTAWSDSYTLPDVHPTTWSNSYTLTDVHTRYAHCDALADTEQNAHADPYTDLASASHLQHPCIG